MGDFLNDDRAVSAGIHGHPVRARVGTAAGCLNVLDEVNRDNRATTATMSGKPGEETPEHSRGFTGSRSKELGLYDHFEPANDHVDAAVAKDPAGTSDRESGLRMGKLDHHCHQGSDRELSVV